MNTYRLRYIAGPQECLRASQERLVQAADPEEALAACSDWPTQCDRKGRCAWAKAPGTSLYDVKAWEAELVLSSPAS